MVVALERPASLLFRSSLVTNLCPMRHAKASNAQAAESLEQIPNIGPAVAEDLRSIGIKAPHDLIGRDPQRLYERLMSSYGHPARPHACSIPSSLRFGSWKAHERIHGGITRPSERQTHPPHRLTAPNVMSSARPRLRARRRRGLIAGSTTRCAKPFLPASRSAARAILLCLRLLGRRSLRRIVRHFPH